jgi:formate-dependent nitrite reductase membrane component NrfD
VSEPEEKPLRTVSFIVHATRGVIRDQKIRRTTMFVILVIAMALLFLGSTFLQAPLNPREHPMGFALFWMACGWLTFTALLLAMFDLLIVRLESRRTKNRLQEDLKPEPPGPTTD